MFLSWVVTSSLILLTKFFRSFLPGAIVTELVSLRRHSHRGQPLVWHTTLPRRPSRTVSQIPDVVDTRGSLLLCLPFSCCLLLSGIDPQNVILVLALRRFAVSCCADPVSDLPSISPCGLLSPVTSLTTFLISLTFFLSSNGTRLFFSSTGLSQCWQLVGTLPPCVNKLGHILQGIYYLLLAHFSFYFYAFVSSFALIQPIFTACFMW